MRTAKNVLSVIQDRGSRGLPVDDLYRQLFNPELFLVAYAKLQQNRGALTPGVTDETVDGMSMDKIEAIISDLRSERFRWSPVRRTYILKKNGTKRGLGMPTWTDKLVQEVMRLILESYFEPQFDNSSHGFRPHRGCHTALSAVQHQWSGMKWFIEGDISKCFDRIDHSVLMDVLRTRIQDNRFLRLIQGLLQAGYMEEWRYHNTFSGTPQGGVLSPLLSNIYMDRLDKFVSGTLIPEYTRGVKRAGNLKYVRLSRFARESKVAGKLEESKEATKLLRKLPAGDPNDPNYRRLKYVRYADDFLLGFIGPKEEAQEIKRRISEFLLDELKLELSPEKTLITHASKEAARFLSYEISIFQADDKIAGNKRSINGTIRLRIPKDIIDSRCAKYMKAGEPTHLSALIHDDDFSIVAQYGAEYRGVVQYYTMAHNLAALARLRWIMEISMLKTLAGKHKSSLMKMKRKYITRIRTEDGLRRTAQVVIHREGKKPLIASFGAVPLVRRKSATLVDKASEIIKFSRNTLLDRLQANECEYCGSNDRCEVHHIRALADLHKKGRRPPWVELMAARRRKTLVVCKPCHVRIHSGLPPRPRQGILEEVAGEPDAMKVASPVRGGVNGKVPK